VTKTLYSYLSRDLLKITLMALVVLTMLFTILVAIEPMRKQGLTGMQVLNLFGYIVPVVLPLTLPISALFAATFVYGRFSQTNELLASKASGLSAGMLLRPAIVLGVLVTVASLWISNFAAPTMARKLGRAVEDNIEGLAYQQLQTKSYWKLSPRFIHADEVGRDSGEVRGVVAAEIRNKLGDVRFLIAPAAKLRFEKPDDEEGKPLVWFDVGQVVVTSTDRYDMALAENPFRDPFPLPDLAKEKASWYTWDELRATQRDPLKNGRVRDLFVRVHRNTCSRALSERIVRAMNAGEPYHFAYEDRTEKNDYYLTAGGAEVGPRGAALLSQRGQARISAVLRRDGRIVRTVKADSGDVSIVPLFDGGTKVVIVLSGQVRTLAGADGPETPLARPWRAEVMFASVNEARDVVRRITESVNAGLGYSFMGDGVQYALTAGSAAPEPAGDGGNGPNIRSIKLSPIRRVTVAIRGTSDKLVTADSGKVFTTWDARSKKLVTTIRLGPGQVTVRTTRWRREGLVAPSGFSSVDELVRHVAEALEAGMSYSFSEGQVEYTVAAGGARAVAGGAVTMRSAEHAGEMRRVRVEYRLGGIPRTVEADFGQIAVTWADAPQKRHIAILLSGNVAIERRKDWTPEHPLPVPADITALVEDMDLVRVAASPQGKDADLMWAVRREVTALGLEIVAERHGRVALGLSCCLLVALGGALGLVFRGGQVLSAFAIAVAPGLVTFVVVFMGQNLVTNPDVAPWKGLAAVWSGDALLVLANLYLYGHVIRR